MLLRLSVVLDLVSMHFVSSGSLFWVIKLREWKSGAVVACLV